MAGERGQKEIQEYLSRLLGEPVAIDQTVALRSVQRAALASWARGNGIVIEPSVIGSSNAFTPRQLLANDNVAVADAPSRGTTQPASIARGPAAGVGIDIEDLENLPQADDYREHPFFVATFAPAEIAYCIRQPNPAASFCGTWAAKEAILKSGVLPTIPSSLASIEIVRDEIGRPGYPGCQLSISHTSRTAVALCLSTPAADQAPAEVTVATPVPREQAIAAASGRRFKLVAAVGAILAVIGTGTLWIFHG